MAFVLLLSIIALLVILAHLDWKWISEEEPLQFTHSIFGIAAIGLSFIQVSFVD